jgi:lysophospholipase L1-like esterase
MRNQPWETTPESKTRPVRTQNSASAGLRFLALGDSYTAGEQVAPAERFPLQLARRLRAMQINIEDPRIIAHAGWTSGDLSAGISAANLSEIYDLVTLLIGVNNQYRGLALEDYRLEFRGLVYRAVELAGGEEKRVIVISLPDWGQTPFAKNFNHTLISQQIDAYNQANRAESSLAGVRYADISAKSRALLKQAGMLASDELHPSAQQYAAWMEILFPEALAALGRF